MISVPFHPTMRIDQLPNGARFVDQGGIKYFELDAINDINVLTQRVTLPQGPTRAIRLSAIVRGDLQYTLNGYEGIAQDVQCLIRNGTSRIPLRTFHNDPFRSGQPELYVPQVDLTNWTQVDVVTQIPYNIETQFIDVSFGHRAFAGQLQIKRWSTRNHYQDRFVTVAGPAIYTRGDFDFQSVSLYSGRIPVAYLNYLNTHSVRIGSGQAYTVSFDGFINNAECRGLSGGRVGFLMGIMLKMKRVDGTVDFKPLSIESTEDGANIANRPIIISTRAISEHNYDQIEPILYVYTGTSDNLISISVDHNGLNARIVVHDSEENGVT